VINLGEVVAAAPELGRGFADLWQAVDQDDLAVLIYTSGTTGPPKAVELTHRSVLGTVQGLDVSIGARDGARVLSYLPMAHMAERVWSHYRSMAHGFTTHCCANPRDGHHRSAS